MKLLHVVTGSAFLVGAIAAASASQPANKPNPLRVSMIASTDGTGLVELEITNTSNHTVRMPKWQLPSNDAESKLFSVSLDGATRPTSSSSRPARPTAPWLTCRVPMTWPRAANTP